MIHGPLDGTRGPRGPFKVPAIFDFRRSRRRRRGTNTSTKKTYDNLENLIADISEEKVTEIDFSTFRNIHESANRIP